MVTLSRTSKKSKLRESSNALVVRSLSGDLVVIDESHNFRNGGKVTTDENDENPRENRYLQLAVKVLPRPTESARMQPLYFSNLLMMARAASRWKLYSLFQMMDSLKPQVLDNITNAYKENSPEFIYFVTLYNIFNEFLECQPFR